MSADRMAARDRLERMYQAYGRSVYRFARQRVPADDAMEIVNDVFAVAWRRLPEIPEAELGWLLGTARRLVANHLRSQRRRTALVDRVAAHDRGPDPDHAPDVAGLAEVEWLLAQLSDKDQEVLRLVIVDDLSISDVAAALGCRPNTASARLARARARLAEVYRSRSEVDPLPPPAQPPPPAQDAHPPRAAASAPL